jgi:hypothetical protein
MPHEHKIQAPVNSGLLDRRNIRGRFYNAQLGVITRGVVTQSADFNLGEGTTLLAMTDSLHGIFELFRQPNASLAVSFQEMKSHALGGFKPNTRQALERLD